MDEAHVLKSFDKSVIWRTVGSLKGGYHLAITGTPIPNLPIDAIGLVSLVVKQGEADELFSLPSTDNPFELPDDDDRTLLQCTVDTFKKWVEPEENLTRQGEYLRKVFRHCLLSRRYSTIMNGKAIGDGIPPIRIETICLRGNAYQQRRLKEIMDDCKAQLLKSFKDYNSIKFVPKVVRTAAQAAFWFPFFHMDSWDGSKSIRALRNQIETAGPEASLKTFLTYIYTRQTQTNVHVLSYDPEPLTTNQLLQKVLQESPKLTYLIYDCAIVQPLLRKKMILG